MKQRLGILLGSEKEYIIKRNAAGRFSILGRFWPILRII
jgi:hypothetical protein